MSTALKFSGFSAHAIEFLVELGLNNEREWFKANQARYEERVREPALHLIREMAPRLRSISKSFVASDKKVGGSLMRPYRDTRFSGDKTPYKTNVGIQFRHAAGRDVHAPGFYLHVEPGDAFIGVGMWHPDAEALAAVRRRLMEKPAQFTRAISDPAFKRWYRLGGESLKRPPAGVAPDHPLIEHLKRKDHIAVATLTHAQLCSPKLVDVLQARFAAAKPYVKFLCDALELPC